MSAKTGLQAKKNVSLTENSKADSRFDNTTQSQEENKKTYKFSTIIVGNASVGKTSILNRFFDNTYSSPYICSINVDFKMKSIQIGKDTIVELIIWDTCGDEKFRAITKQFYKKGQGVLAVFDITNLVSFKHLEVWLDEIGSSSPKDPIIFIVGNKSDLESERTVSEKEIQEFVQSHGYEYYEVSANTGMNIHLLFERMAGKLVNNKGSQENVKEVSTSVSKINQKITVDESKGCC